MLAFEEAGPPANRPLIFLHGWCCNRGHMRELMTRLAGRHHVIAVDLPGHGESPLGDVSPTFDSFAASICSFIAERQLHQPVLVGHSMGGVISVVAAAGDPGLVAGVVNLDGAVPLAASVRDGYRDLFTRVGREGFRPDAWVARVAVSGHFMQIFALSQVVAMIEKFLAVEIER
jgi:pimeloyl-ACP methyl ester carboxylesterase